MFRRAHLLASGHAPGPADGPVLQPVEPLPAAARPHRVDAGLHVGDQEAAGSLRMRQ